jgi:hypothetical protein
MGNWKQTAGRARGFLYLDQRATGFDGDATREPVDIADRPHPVQRQHDLLARTSGNGTAAKAGLAAGWDNADPGLGAKRDDPGDFGYIGGPHHDQRLAVVDFQQILAPRRHIIRVGQQPSRTDDVSQFRYHWKIRSLRFASKKFLMALKLISEAIIIDRTPRYQLP